ncbi:elongation factor P maturation arginine rhamnosyltransferase EarP [Acidovorax sp. RAC01]|uniref:elongation factor P maturation arginine rhamnosyltransferase EarP n=1 Tax=Acidovorax sp. RAC01 TaxID=1842533 RepID=UPI00083E86D6|nr:elongation factor P maturation arginine rhamnosyltransferase EarP [Acidovorax sp. RAC01]AOG22616.1 hypothetical protein BSY15_4119 [Acidovorax sp. RAC01]
MNAPDTSGLPDTPRQWDVFCQVIDNFGDIGVCWRFAADLAARGQQVRLWVDDASALAWMAPEGCEGVDVRPWHGALPGADDRQPEVIVEAFGCEIRADFIAYAAARAQATGIRPVWINLEYLSAESYVERNHGLPSPVMSGPAAGWTRWFFYPGFTRHTGGLLHETGLMQRRAAFDATAWRARHLGDCAADGLAPPPPCWISLFCYEPAALPGWLQQLQGGPARTHLLVTPGRAQAAVQAALGLNRNENGPQRRLHKHGQLSISYLTPRAQAAFDELLWASDLNAVRGEDSLVRALWAGQALVWHIYPQHDNAHHAKLHAFLDWLQAPPSLRQFHDTWNGLDDRPLVLPDADTLAEWTVCVRSARQRLLTQDNLTTQILGFVAEKR